MIKSEKKIINKLYIQYDYNYGEIIHRKKEEELGEWEVKLPKIPRGKYDGFLLLFSSFYISMREVFLFQGKLKGFGVRQHSYNC